MEVEQVMVLQAEYKSTTRRRLATALVLLWELVDSLRPPWLQFMGCATALIWVNAVLSGWHRFTVNGPPEFRFIESVLGSWEWAVLSFLMAMLSGYAFCHPDKRLLRRNVLLIFAVYSMIPAIILGLAVPGTPMGQWNFLLSIICFTAFLRPLVLHFLERLKEKTEES